MFPCRLLKVSLKIRKGLYAITHLNKIYFDFLIFMQKISAVIQVQVCNPRSEKKNQVDELGATVLKVKIAQQFALDLG